MPLIIPANSAVSGGFDVANSVRYNGSNDSMNRTFSSGNQKTWTWSMWIKRSKLSVDQTLFGRMTATGDAGWFNMSLNSDDTITFGIYNTSYRKTNRVFRDTSAWYHIVLAFDTTQGTAANRIKFYINGVEETSFSTSNDPSQNFDAPFNANAVHSLGIQPIPGGYEKYYGGYISEVTFIDGAANAVTDFGEFDEDSGIWKPISVSGLTFGTNGFYLDFQDSSALGNDAAGSNNWTVVNLTAIDQSTDTCTLNMATMNFLDLPASNQPTFSEGNLKVVSPIASGNNNFGGASTFVVSSGKWYIEAKATVGAGGYSRNRIGITGNESTARINNTLGANSYEYFYDSEAGNSNAGSYGNSYTTGDIIGIALNLDDNELKFYKNGTVQNSGTAISIDAPSSTSIGGYKIAQSDSSGVSGATSTFEFNFGSPPYSESGGNSDGDGYGNFAGSVPSGHFAINSKNLAEYG